MKNGLKLAAVMIFGAGAAAAQITTDGVIQDLSAQGYSRIEVANGPTQMKVEAIRGTEKLEVIYDTDSGAVLKQETDTVSADDNTAPGVQVRTRTRDFVRAQERVRTGMNDDSDDDSSDDDGSDDDSSDDDGSDDHGGSGGDDDGGDDNGGDHGGHGSDD